MICPLLAGKGLVPASAANAASERIRPGCDQLTQSCAATIGPMPGSASSCGTALAVRALRSVSAVLASSVSARARRASRRSDCTRTQVSRSSDPRERSVEQAAIRPAMLRSCRRRRSSSGAVITKSRIWLRTAVRWRTNRSRSTSSSRAASRSPSMRGCRTDLAANADRAASSASMGSLLPARRVRRVGRSTSVICAPTAASARQSPAPWLRVPSIAHSSRPPETCSATHASRRA